MNSDIVMALDETLGAMYTKNQTSNKTSTQDPKCMWLEYCDKLKMIPEKHECASDEKIVEMFTDEAISLTISLLVDMIGVKQASAKEK